MPIFILLPLLETSLAVAVGTLAFRVTSDLYRKLTS